MDIGAWYAFLAPAGTPKDVVSKLNETVATILSDPEIQKDFHEPWVAASEKLAGAVCGLDTKRKRSHGVDHLFRLSRLCNPQWLEDLPTNRRQLPGVMVVALPLLWHYSWHESDH